MRTYSGALATLGVMLALIATGYLAQLSLAVQRDPLRVLPFMGGGEVDEHAFSRYHARWYVVSLLLLAFDMEMLFMYPWTLVVRLMGGGSVLEMFTFLTLLVAGVGYAAREGGFRWA